MSYYTGTYDRLNLHVCESNLTLIRAVRKKLKKSARRDPKKRAARHAMYREFMKIHHDARKMYMDVMGGRF